MKFFIVVHPFHGLILLLLFYPNQKGWDPREEARTTIPYHSRNEPLYDCWDYSVGLFFFQMDKFQSPLPVSFTNYAGVYLFQKALECLISKSTIWSISIVGTRQGLNVRYRIVLQFWRESVTIAVTWGKPQVFDKNIKILVKELQQEEVLFLSI